MSLSERDHMMLAVWSEYDAAIEFASAVNDLRGHRWSPSQLAAQAFISVTYQPALERLMRAAAINGRHLRVPPFGEVIQLMKARGYVYGDDEMAQVKLGYELLRDVIERRPV